MKFKILILFMVFVLLISSVYAQSGTLVAYFSLAGEQYEVGVIDKGNTEIVAELIASLTSADLFSIVPDTPYPETYRELLNTAMEENEDNHPSILNAVENMDRYKTVFIGYPIWNGDMPWIVRDFLSSYDFSGKTIIPFCTHAGSRFGRSLSTLKALLPDSEILEGFAVRGSIAQQNESEAMDLVRDWLEAIK